MHRVVRIANGPRRWLTLLAAMAMSVSSVAPALAAKPAKNDKTETTQSCSSLDPGATTTVSEIRDAIGVDVARDAYDVLGRGVGVAVIDTGINAVAGVSDVIDGPDLSFDAMEDDLRFRDLHGHGTNMAGIIAMDDEGDGGGVAPDAHLVNVKVGAGDGAVDVSQVIAAIDWVVQNRNVGGANIRVINLAFNTNGTQNYLLDPLAHAVGAAWKAGVVVVASGGNDGRAIKMLGNPAINPFVIAVGAAYLNSGGWNVAPWSSTGDGVRNPDVVAPGDAVLSSGVAGSFLAETYPTAVCLDGNGELFLRGSGTSQAAAAVAGAAALLLEHRPELTPDQVKHLLTSTATSLGKPESQQGHGLVNVPGALAAPTPHLTAVQTHVPSSGLGSLEAARGSYHVQGDDDQLEGEVTAFGGDWIPSVWTAAADSASAWTGQTYLEPGPVWTGGTWMGATWSGSRWSGDAWSGGVWSGSRWSGSRWSGATWSGAAWSGSRWSGATWSGATWSGATWSGVGWS